MSQPLTLFVFLGGAGCKVTAAKVSILGETDSDRDAHELDHHDDTEAKEHEAEEHEGEHSEFHGEYALSCSNVAAITAISFPYFEVFPNSAELVVTLVTEKGQKVFEVNREHAVIDTRGLM